MTTSEVQTAFEARGGPPETVAWGTSVGEVPEVASHQWIVLEVENGDVVIGGRDRGRFAAYGRFADAVLAAETLVVLLSRPEPSPLPRSGDELDRAAHGLLALLERAAGELAPGESVPGSRVPVGAVLDHLGNGSGHVLHPLGTPMSQRSLPPTDLTQPRTGYLVVRELPEACRVSRVAPWFGQPGGGWMVALDRVIDYYCDTGVLQPFAVPA